MLAPLVGLAGAGCGGDILSDVDPPGGEGLRWVAPREDLPLPEGEPVVLTMQVAEGAARVRFFVDGAEVGACDPSAPEADCQAADLWSWTTPALGLGPHELGARVEDAAGGARELALAVEVRADSGDDELWARDGANDGAEAEPDSDTDGQPATDGTALVPLESVLVALAGRGFLDPNRAFHRIFGGIAWEVSGQRVILHHGTPRGSVSAVARCMRRFGRSIRRHADAHRVSRGSVVATALTESSCTNPSGSSDGLSSGPMQVTGSTCAALTGLSSSTCKRRMHANPDFSFAVGVRYMASRFQVHQHHHDPPKIAAAYNAGSLRPSSSNRWHLVSTGNHIDRFVAAYNAYRRWERLTRVVPDGSAGPVAAAEDAWDGAHVAELARLPGGAVEGTVVFVGDLAGRDGVFYRFGDGRWSADED